MSYTPKTLPNGDPIPAIGYGTWAIGGRVEADASEDERSVTGIRAALRAGYTHIDTAEMYAAGHTEELVAQAIHAAGAKREDLFITSKVWPKNLVYGKLQEACENSLRRLGTDYLDLYLYLIHWPGDTPLEESFRALNELQAAGKIRHVGVSDFDVDLMKQSQALCDSPLATNQVPYSLHTQTYVENGVIEYCQKAGILLTAYTPLEKGKIGSDARLKTIANRLGVSSVQVARAWLIHQPQVIAIPMSLNPVHIQENLAAADIDLSAADIASLNAS